jgi:hypothetical protein
MANADYEPTEWCNVHLPPKHTDHQCRGHPTTALSLCRHPAMYEPHHCAGHRPFKVDAANAWLRKAVAQINAQRRQGYDPFAFVKKRPIEAPANPKALPPIVPKNPKRKLDQLTGNDENRPPIAQQAAPVSPPPQSPSGTDPMSQSSDADSVNLLSTKDVDMTVAAAPLQTVAANNAPSATPSQSSSKKTLYTNASQIGTGPAKPHYDAKYKKSSKPKPSAMDTN